MRSDPFKDAHVSEEIEYVALVFVAKNAEQMRVRRNLLAGDLHYFSGKPFQFRDGEEAFDGHWMERNGGSDMGVPGDERMRTDWKWRRIQIPFPVVKNVTCNDSALDTNNWRFVAGAKWQFLTRQARQPEENLIGWIEWMSRERGAFQKGFFG